LRSTGLSTRARGLARVAQQSIRRVSGWGTDLSLVL
jgi:hypothetical protein